MPLTLTFHTKVNEQGVKNNEDVKLLKFFHHI